MQYKEIGQNLEEGMKGLGNQIRSMPHLVIGKENTNPAEPKKPIFNEKESKVVDNIKKWGLILIVLIIIVYSIYRIFS